MKKCSISEKIKKVLSHLKSDQRTFKEEINDDKKLVRQLKKRKK